MAMAAADPDLIFVYGLLMRGFDLHQHMAAGAFVGEGMVHGTLLNLGQYPGLVAGSSRVRGELYRFADLPAALDVLDEIEEYNPTDPARSLYLRAIRRVELASGETMDAWVYIYNGDAAKAPVITSGDWRARS